MFYLLTLPLAIFAMRSANPQDLATPGLYRANQLTILLHNVGSLSPGRRPADPRFHLVVRSDAARRFS